MKSVAKCALCAAIAAHAVERRAGSVDWVMDPNFACDEKWELIKETANQMHRMSINTIAMGAGRNTVTYPAAVVAAHAPDTQCFLGELTMQTWLAFENGGSWSARLPPQFVLDVAKLPARTLMDIAYSGWPIFSILSIWSDVVGGAQTLRRPPTIEQIWADQKYHPENDPESLPVRTAMAAAYLGEKSLHRVVDKLEHVKNDTSLDDFAAMASWYRLWELLDAMSLSTPWVHINEHPRIWMRVMPYRDMMSDRLRAFKQFHCPSSVTQVIDNLPENTHMIEVGSNLGDCTLYFLSKRSQATAVAFEVVPQVADAMTASLKANNLDHRCIVVNKAVTTHPGTWMLTYNRDRFFNMATQIKDGDSGQQSQWNLGPYDGQPLNDNQQLVEAVRLDDEMLRVIKHSHKLGMRPFPSRVNFMRLHVNDNELDVLRGGVRTVKNTDALHVHNFHRGIRPPIIEKVKEINPAFRIDSKEEYDFFLAARMSFDQMGSD